MTQAEPIEDLLMRERDALRRADFTALRDLATEKERLVTGLADAPITDPDTLARLRRLAERNDELLDAVKRGAESAANSLSRALSPAEPLSTYDPKGQSALIGAINHALTRRA